MTFLQLNLSKFCREVLELSKIPQRRLSTFEDKPTHVTLKKYCNPMTRESFRFTGTQKLPFLLRASGAFSCVEQELCLK